MESLRPSGLSFANSCLAKGLINDADELGFLIVVISKNRPRKQTHSHGAHRIPAVTRPISVRDTATAWARPAIIEYIRIASPPAGRGFLNPAGLHAGAIEPSPRAERRRRDA